MNLKDKTACIERYRSRLHSFADSPETLGWGGGRERQEARFETHCQIEEFAGKPILSVLDVGCGFGDMGAYLARTRPQVRYVGVDVNPDLLAVGREKYPELDLRVHDVLEADLAERFDLVCESGIFNYQLRHEGQHEYIRKMLGRFFGLCTVGVSADFMSAYVDFKHENAFHFPEAAAVAVGRELSKRFVLRGDYLDYEYCLQVLRT